MFEFKPPIYKSLMILKKKKQKKKTRKEKLNCVIQYDCKLTVHELLDRQQAPILLKVYMN